MGKGKVLTRKGQYTDELYEAVEKEYKGLILKYVEIYYLDYAVDEDTGMIDKMKKEKFYTKDHVKRNLRELKSAFNVAKGAASPEEIKSFRLKYRIAASILSVILGFSKNTISNIESEGVTSLPTGRLIKLGISNKKTLTEYIKVCDQIDKRKKEELFLKLA